MITKKIRFVLLITILFVTCLASAQDAPTFPTQLSFQRNLSNKDKDELILKNPTFDASFDEEAWVGLEEALDLVIVTPKDLGYGRDYSKNDFFRKVTDEYGLSLCPNWVPVQLYLTGTDQDRPLIFYRGTMRMNGFVGVYHVGPNKKKNKVHDLFLSEINGDPRNSFVFVKRQKTK